jgi:putative membrane protein
VAAWLLPALVTIVPGALYLAGVARVRGNGRGWSGWRIAGFGLGLLLIAAALSPKAEVVAADAWGHMVQHLLLGMYAPLALVLGRPLTLLLAVLPMGARRPVAAVLRSRPHHLLVHVTTASVLSVGGLYLLYLTPLYALNTRSEIVHLLLQAHFLFAGYLFAWAVAGPDLTPRRPRMRVRIAVVILAGGAHSFLAKLLYSRAPDLPPGSGHGTGEIELAAQWMYFGGHLADVLLLTALFASWYRRTGRRPLAIPAPSGAGVGGPTFPAARRAPDPNGR